MALETATFISDLAPANPAASDAKSQGDDHIRLVKSVLKSTFPNMSGAVSANNAELSYMQGLTIQPAAKDGSNLTTPAPGDNSTKIATTAFVVQAALTSTLPGQAGNSGRFLQTDGANASWAQVLPPMGGNNGKVLATDGITTYWTQSLPSQAGNSGKLLKTDGSTAQWYGLSSSDVATALGFTPYSASNPSGYITMAQATAPTAPIKLQDGTQAAPALVFGSDLTTGFFRIGAGTIGVVCSGVLVGKFDVNGIHGIKLEQTT